MNTTRYSCASRISIALLISFLLASVPSAVSQERDSSRTKTYEFRDGLWFDGQVFKKKVFYTFGGMLTTKRPARVDEIIDLKNGFVVPPFGEAHCHNFDDPFNVAQQVNLFLQHGVFYAKVQTDVRTGAEKVAADVNKPTSVDVVYAHGGLTSSNSHPIMLYEALALGFYTPEQWKANDEKIRKSRLRENDAYYIIDNATDLKNKWPIILAGRPDFIKVFLLAGGEYGKGIDPKLLPEIVARAHSAGLRVSAHVDTRENFHTALVSRVDEIQHLPGYSFTKDEDERKYEISVEDVRRAARQNVRLVPTLWRGVAVVEEPLKTRIRDFTTRSLRLLKSHGVEFAVGEDIYGRDSLQEAMYLSELGVFSNLEMLKLWCEETPEMIFPRRKIGRLREGYEASFLVLEGNPLEDFSKVQKIRLRVKQGYLITLATSSAITPRPQTP